MGGIFGKHSRYHGLSKIEKKMVNAMKEKGACGKSSLKTFNSIIMMFPKIDKTFEAVRDTFRKFDKNGNGTLDLEEVKDCFRELHVSFTDEEVKDLYAESDMDANSGIDFKEFIVLLALVYLLSSPRDKSSKSRLGLAQLEDSFDRIADAFVFFDKDCDGHVSKEEIIEAIGQASPGSRNADRIGLKRFGVKRIGISVTFVFSSESPPSGLLKKAWFSTCVQKRWIGIRMDGSHLRSFCSHSQTGLM